MTTFGVWAPDADQVDLILDGGSTAMTGNADGWWRADAPEAGPGARYGFSIDGGPVLPDPRSRSQPDGVHGRSEVLDPAFEWTDQHWRGTSLPGSVLYELHVGTFSPEGTFDGVAARLPHLVELGVDAIELLPVAEFSGDRGWGYDGVDLFAPHHAYGGWDGMRRLVDACHAHGLGVVIDVVYNHLGPDGNHLGAFGPYFSSDRSTNWGDAVNLDGPGSDEVRRFFLDNALMWLDELHCDGLRIDAAHAIEDRSAVHLLEQLATEVDALAAHRHRPLFLVAECDLNDPRYVRAPDAGGFGLDAVWADEWHHALHAVLTGEVDGYYEDFGSFDLLAKALRQAWVYDGVWSPHRKRTHGRSPAGLTGDRFVISVQNHDQVGNRARGDRLGATASIARSKVAAALLLTAPFTPMLFQGEEWGASAAFAYFTDHQDPDLAQAVTEGRRREFAHFGWAPEDVLDPQDPDTFCRSTLDWSEVDQPPHADLLDWHRRLIALRRDHPDLADPRLDRHEVIADAERSTIDVRRGAIRVLVNLGTDAHRFDHDGGTGLRLLLGSAPTVEVTGHGVVVPPDGVAIVEADPIGQ